MYKLIKITKLEELQSYLDNGMIGQGTFSTGKFALQQGKPTFLAVDNNERV
jgi:hypothetical protein